MAENVVLAREPRGRLGLIDRRAARARVQEILESVRSRVGPDEVVRDLPFADRQMVEIAKSLVTNPRLLILDEPTSGLREREVDILLDVVRGLRNEGRSVVLITHRLREMFAVADRFLVLKDGASVGTREQTATSPPEIIRLMVGRDLAALYPQREPPARTTETVLAVRGFTVPATSVHDVDLELRSGEVLGVAGLAGHGQNELLEGLAGLRHGRGRLFYRGAQRRPFASAASAIEAGVVLIPEDRKTQGLVLPMTVAANLALGTLGRRSRLGFVDVAAEQELTRASVTALAIRPPRGDVPAGGLSGGNQQKVVIGKWLAANPRVFLCADPTRGIDVGTKLEIYRLLRLLADQGAAVAMVSTDLSEIVGVCDRVVVMATGRIVAELDGEAMTEERIAAAAFGEAATHA